MRVPGSGPASTSTRSSPPVASARPRELARAHRGAGARSRTRGCRANLRHIRWAPTDARTDAGELPGRGPRVAARAAPVGSRSSSDDPSDDPSPDALFANVGQTRSTDREDAFGTLGTDPMSDEWFGGDSRDEGEDVDARRTAIAVERAATRGVAASMLQSVVATAAMLVGGAALPRD